MEEYVSRSLENRPVAQWPSIGEHSKGVAEFAAQAAGPLCEWARLLGLLHDIGKYSAQFQKKIYTQSREFVDHKTAGAKEAEKLGRPIGLALAYCLFGHHNGLPDRSRLEEALKSAIPDYSAYHKAEPLPGLPKASTGIRLLSEQKGFSLAFWMRMLYSCLVDADALDAQRATDPRSFSHRGGGLDMRSLALRLEAKLVLRYGDAKPTPVNLARAEVLCACRQNAGLPPGLFSLTVPTGGGKTLSSLLFALSHAAAHELERVIYVIPYNSIISQNAAEFRDVLGKENVLEHHANVQRNDKEEETAADLRWRLAAENWDAPVIATTAVQFFESIFSNKPARCRKNHRLARSVIVLDEAQMMPPQHLRPCLAALSELVANYGSTVVLCTATQPALENRFAGGLRAREIAPDPPSLSKRLRRVRLRNAGFLANEEIVRSMLAKDAAMCVVNTRAHALELYEGLVKTRGEDVWHLSASMTSAHREEAIKRIRNALAARRPCYVISTQLVECGVDLDFPMVMRALAGLDNIVQAAGRCNREGKADGGGELVVFEPGEGSRGQTFGWMRRCASYTREIAAQYEDLLSLEAIHRYFELLYGNLEVESGELSMDKARALADAVESKDTFSYRFEQVAKDFHIIDEATCTVIVPNENNRDAIEALINGRPDRALLRRLQADSVSVHERQFSDYARSGAVKALDEQLGILTDLALYGAETGLLPLAGGRGEFLLY